MKIVYFLLLRGLWALAIQSVHLAVRLGCPGCVVNGLGALMGMSWAFREMRRLGWEFHA